MTNDEWRMTNDDEEKFNEEISLQNDKHDNSIELDWFY